MNRDYYKVTYATDRRMPTITDDVLDNEEFNANQFKLFDDFTTDLRNCNSSSFHQVRRRGDPNDSGVDMENGNLMDDVDTDLLENEVMVDPWSSMESSNSPLSESGPSVSEESSATGPPPAPAPAPAPRAPAAARARTLTLPLDVRPHFLDDDYPHPSNVECRIPKPHFLDHSPSPDELDERGDITNPNFLDDDADDDHKKAGALPKKPAKTPTGSQEDRPHRTSYRSTLHYGLENAARSSERDKRASQLYRGTWAGERDAWPGHDAASVRSFSSNGSGESHRASSHLDNKMECVYSLISLLSLSPENNADLSGPLLDMSRSVENCIAMRQAGCIPLLVQLIHSKVPRETRDRAAKALRNIIHTQTDDKAGRREARVWRLLEQVREYCYILEDVVENRKEGKEFIDDDGTKHPSQSVAALMKLSFDEEHRHVVCQLGGLQALAALVSGDQAAHGSRADDNTCLTMRKYAGMTLTNLTFGDGNNKSLLCSFKDFMLALVEQLESPNDDMRQVTAAVLRNLSWRADSSSKQVLREVGAVKGLTKAAMTCQKEATLKSVLSALWNLTAHCSMNKVALCSVDGALGFLVDMLSYDSPTKTLAIVENAGGIMRNVSSHIAVREDYRQILRERNCLGVLLQHLKSPSLTVVSNSCGTLWNLSARCPQDQQFLWDHGAVPMLRSLIHSKHKMIAMGSGAALKNLLNSKPGKTHIVSLDTTARTMNLPALPTLGARKQKALEQELDQNLAETCDNIEPATSPTTSNREEKNLFTATERQIAMNLERHRMTSSSPLMGALTSQISLSHSAHLASYLSCSNTLLKGALVTRSTTGSSSDVNRSDSKDSVTSAQSDTVFEKVMRTGKVPVPTPRNKDLMRSEAGGEAFKASAPPVEGAPPVPPPRAADARAGHAGPGSDAEQDSCDQPVDFSRKYPETKAAEPAGDKPKAASKKKGTFGDYQETDLDQPTDYSLRYAEHHSDRCSESSEPPGPAAHEDTIQHFATEGTPYETPVVFSTATSMSDLRVIGKDGKPRSTPSVKENPEAMTHSDEKDTCSVEEPPRPDNDRALATPRKPAPDKRGAFDTKFSSGMISPEKPVNYCDEGTPGCFSRVSSLSSLGEPTEEDSLAKKNAMATINVEPSLQESTGASKDKEGSKAVTFACSPGSGGVQDTPLMFSRSSSLGSLPSAPEHDQGSVLSEVSRLTSGCISPSEIPDSPGAPGTPPGRAPPPAEDPEWAGSDSPPAGPPLARACSEQPSPLELRPGAPPCAELGGSAGPVGQSEPPRGTQTPGDSCRVYFTEDTPALLSTAGSHSNLSALSVESAVTAPPLSDSSLSDAGVLQACIQRGIDQVVKHKGPPSEVSPVKPYDQDDIYRSLPPNLRSSTETVMVSQELNINRDSASPPPLPPKDARAAAPPRPPPPSAGHHESRLPVKTQRCSRQRSKPGARRDSSSSLSLDSFGSTDREIFEETVRQGLSSVAQRAGGPPRARPRSLDRGDRLPRRSRAHGERGAGRARRAERSGSLSSLSNESFGSTDKEVFERCVRAGMARAPSGERRPARRRAARSQGALDKMRGEDARDRALLEQVIARGCLASKNAAAPPAPPARAGGAAPRARERSRERLAEPPPQQDAAPPDDLDRSNESYADCFSDDARDCDPGAPDLTLPDLLTRSDARGSSRPDLTSKLQEGSDSDLRGDHELDSLMALAIEKEAARLAAQLNTSYSESSTPPLELDDVRPLSTLGSPLSLSADGPWDDSPSRRSRKKSLPVAAMVRRALTNSMNQSSERLDSNPASMLDNVKPPPEMDQLDLESSMLSVCSIVSEVADRERTPVVFDLREPVRDFPLCHDFILDLDRVNPPSLFDEMAESTTEAEPSAARPPDDATDTLRAVTDVPSGSESCTPLPSDLSSVESTPKKQRDPRYLTPKEKRSAAKDRYQTYTIIEPPEAPRPSEEFVTWTKSESERSDECGAGGSEKPKRKTSAKQRRLEDRARYRTQTVDINSLVRETKTVDPEIESLKRRLAAKRTMKQRRAEDAERFRTRTLSEDVPPSPTFVSTDATLEAAETTTGYDSLSSAELSPRAPGAREPCRPDSGLNDDDVELNTTQMQTYTRSFRNYLPVVESPAAVDICVVNNLKNIEMTESYRRALQTDKLRNPSSGDFASYEGDCDSERVHSDTDGEPPAPPKPKITKPERRDDSLDSNESQEQDPKAVRGRKKAAYVSPYRRSVPPAKKPTPTKATPKPAKVVTPKAQSAKPSNKAPGASKPPSANTSPKKTLNKSPATVPRQQTVALPLAGKPLPLERQGTFTKEESSVPARDLPVPDKKPIVSRYAKNATPKQAAINTSPSRLPQLNRCKPPLKKSGSSEKPAPKTAKPAMRSSASNHSLHSNDSAKTVTLASRGSRQGSTSSVNSISTKTSTKDVESKIASLWKKVEQNKKTAKPDKRVWIESDKTEPPKLIRSSTFEGQPKQSQVSAPKQKTAIGIKVSQIPSLRPKSSPSKINAPAVKKTTRVFARKPVNGPT